MPSVLIVDSDATSAQELQRGLQAERVDVHTVSDGNEGLEKARALKPDLMILCVELTRVSGYSICNKLKKDPELSLIPLILTSSQATDETFEQHRKLKTKAEGYVKKPYEFADMMTLVGKFIPLLSAKATPSRLTKTRSNEFRLGDVGHEETTQVAPEQRDANHPVAGAQGEEERFDLESLELEPIVAATTVRHDAAHGTPKPTKLQSAELALADLDEADITPAPHAPTPSQSRPQDSSVSRKTGETRVLPPNDGAGRYKTGELPRQPSRVREGARERAPEPSVDATHTIAQQPEAWVSDMEEEAPVPPASATKTVPAGHPTEDVLQLRADSRQLRERVEELEATLQERDREFNDRLTEETARSRELVELKRRISNLERELAKTQQSAEDSREEYRQELLAAETAHGSFAAEQEALLERVRLQSLQAAEAAHEYQDLQAAYQQVLQAQETTAEQLDQQIRARQKAKKAVDIALQLLQDPVEV